MESLKKKHRDIRVVEPSDEEYAGRRVNIMGRGNDRTPLGFAVPKNAQEVADLVRWAKATGTQFCVRSGGNDFYGRSLVDDGLVIDMKEIKSVKVSEDRKTVTVGGGIISRDLVGALEKEGLVVPFGNAGFVGYIGWVTMGGYGPLSNTLGMGFGGIVGAELVDANGEIVTATEEVLEGLRGMGGNLGIVTSLTLKVHPTRKFLNGYIVMEASEDNIRTLVAANRANKSSGAALMHFIIADMADRTKTNLSTNFSWDGEDLAEGQKFLEDYLKALPPVKANTVKEVTPFEFANAPDYPALPYGGVRSVILEEIDDEAVDRFIDAYKTKTFWGNMTWSEPYNVDQDKLPKNTFSSGRHVFLTISDIAAVADGHAETKEWADAFDEALKSCKTRTPRSYPPLTKPGTRTAKEMMGDKHERAMELKRKYDPENVFCHAVPKL